MTSVVRRLSTAVLTLFILGLAIGQLLVPVVAGEMAVEFPEVPHLVTPYSILGILSLACAQAALVTIGILLHRSGRGELFTDRSRALLRAGAGAAIAACLIPAGTGIHLLATMHAGGPGVLLGIGAALAGAAGFACAGAVALHAFDAARAEHTELEAVI